MRYQHLVEPIEPDNVCGPDLDDELDNDYLNYMMLAEGKLPTAYFDKDRNPFPRQSIDFAEDIEPAAALLERSRDLRLLSLEGRLRILSGDISGFCDCISACAALLTERWDDVHPGSSGNHTERQSALNGFNSRTSACFPLIFAPIVRDKRKGDITLRMHMLATGAATAQGAELAQGAPDEAEIQRVLSAGDNAKEVETVHQRLTEALEAFDVIYNQMVNEAGYEYAPDFDTIRETIGDLLELIGSARNDLTPTNEPEAGVPASVDETAEVPDALSLSEVAPVRPAAAAPGAIGDHRDAKAALAAAEQYFARMEPSAPALVLIRQAKYLVGRPLIDALVALVPDKAEQMVILLDPNQNFLIGMERLRELSDQPGAWDEDGAGGGDGDDPADGADDQTSQAASATGSKASARPAAKTRNEAVAVMTEVETFFQKVEPSSPIPLLMRKAKTYMNRDFNYILRDFLEYSQRDDD
ncbi:type VI secretion system ImpA family N-terminal domain-containing protein [Fulvimarina sp. MAC3]|uniref:type VI secretion system protein TssA n=1 Tax=Fulvimarina sp. MAC3 TaxID=3148887 RepID=UPI0031FD4CD5